MGKGLKAALQSQQSRLKAKEKAQAAAHAAVLKGRKPSIKGKAIPESKAKGKEKPLMPNQRPTIPFVSTDRILLIGEGNFSFARALVIYPPSTLDNLPPNNVTATAYDTEQECYEKYPDAEEIVAALRDRGVEILFGVDATKLEKVHGFKGRKWDRIVWNFPHAGSGITDQDRNILSNQILILDFLRSASRFLNNGPVPSVHKHKKRIRTEEEEEEDVDINDADGSSTSANPSIATRGTILLTLRHVPPYTLWDVPRLAKKPPQPTSASKPPNPHYIQLRSFVFHRDLWTGYEHRMTKGERAHGVGKTGEGGEDRTWEFCLRD
ncbi:hypothetical protein D9756_006104 [Leucocoprinus leucothites]|uniref:25S rRNA (uridine-N(3))-methyltransferase BMT5-like domain-containing protein n=1 Tax=Leucocoprinus leucothites TaxID=201217 RepID=A0A8H5FXY9_9AGAR|nr:hypothetical protein D9756_006104 [Leucoagaricus leucothites]